MNTWGMVLAGGASLRMQEDKANLSLCGVSLLKHQFYLLSSLLGEENVLISGSRKHYPCVEDLRSGLGPLEGLRSVCLHLLKQTESGYLLVLPVDMPFLDRGVIQALIDKARPDSDGVRYQEEMLPFLIRFSQDLTDSIAEVEARKWRYSYFSLFELLHLEQIPVRDKRHFVNVNTPEEWKQVVEYGYQA